jgi:hypothetical protein
MAGTGKRIRVIRSILLAGHHAQEGDILVVSRELAKRLIAYGSAVPCGRQGKEQQPLPLFDRIAHPTYADPRASPPRRD